MPELLPPPLDATPPPPPDDGGLFIEPLQANSNRTRARFMVTPTDPLCEAPPRYHEIDYRINAPLGYEARPWRPSF
jgi:hypothetical protein